MYGTGPDERNAPIEADMATLTYEDGLYEIDSFFNSSPSQADTITKAATSKTSDDDDVPTEEKTAPLPAMVDTMQHEQIVMPATEQPANNNEFATLIEDLEQVTSSEAASTNPKGQLHFILNDPTSTTPQASESVSRAGGEPAVVSTGVASTGPGDPQLGQTQTQEEAQVAQGSGEANHSPTNIRSSAPDKAVSLASTHSEKGLTLRSPRPSQPMISHPSYTSAVPQQNAAFEFPQITSPYINDLPLPSPGQAPGLKSAMSEASPLVASSPNMPSSDGKAILYEEMRDEDYYAKRSHTPEDEPIHLPDLTVVAKKPDAEQLAASGTVNNSGDRKESSKEQSIKDADVAQQNAKALVAADREEGQPPSEVSEFTEVEESEDETGDTRGRNAITVTKVKGTSDAKTKAGGSNPTKKVSEPKQKARPTPQRRRSTHNQQTVQYQESASDEADNEAQTEPDPQASVPAKRRTKVSPAPPAKRVKTQSRPKSETVKNAGVDPPQSPSTKSGPATQSSRVVAGGHPMGKREMKELMQAHIGKHVTLGPRMSRAQEEEENRKKEEREKQLPNAGRAAKERHKRKSA